MGIISFNISKEIKQIIAEGLPAILKQSVDNSSNSYDHVKESKFKTSFLKVIQGNIYDKINDTQSKLIKNATLDDKLYEEFKELTSKPKYKAMLNARKKLPSFEMKDQIIDIIEENQVVVISGDTGNKK